MGMALNKSIDGGTTFEQVSVDVADYTITGWQGSKVATFFNSVKDSNDTMYLMCGDGNALSSYEVAIIAIDKNGAKRVTKFSDDSYSCSLKGGIVTMQLSRDEQHIFVNLFRVTDGSNGYVNLIKFPTNFQHGVDIPFPYSDYYYREYNANFKFAIYQDRYIWVASGTTVKIYDYDTKAELASVNSPGGVTSIDMDICCSKDNELYIQGYNNGTRPIVKLTYNGISTIVDLIVVVDTNAVNYKQLLIDRFGDLIILTNTETSSTLLKYSNTGTLIDTVNLSVAGILGVGRGAYGLQVYSKDNGTKCWVQFSNDLGTWRTAETTAQGQAFGAVSKIRNNGVTTYGDDHGGDNNYSVRC